MLRGVWDAAHGRDGFVSYEVDPRLAHDAEATVREAWELYEAVGEPNVMIKIPATDAGIQAVEEVLAKGVSVNITLPFSPARYAQVQGAWERGMARAQEAGHELSGIASVASFFVSRVDAAVEPLLGERGGLLRGDAAVANARLAHERFASWRESEPVRALCAAGAPIQRLLWASTGVKDERLSPTLYVEELVGPETVNTMPEQTLRAVAESERGFGALTEYSQARGVIMGLRELGIDLDEVAERLEAEGEEKFVRAWESLLAATTEQLEQLR